MIYLVLEIVLVFLAIVFALISIFLLMPFGVSMRFAKEGASASGQVAVSWFGIRLIRRRIPSEEEPAEKKPSKKRKFNLGKMLSSLQGSPEYAPILFNGIRRAISIRNLSGNLILGFDDPVDTATAIGYFYSLASVVNTLPRTSISIEPDFHEERLDGSMVAEIRVRMLRIAIAFVRSYMKKPFRDLLGVMRGK